MKSNLARLSLMVSAFALTLLSGVVLAAGGPMERDPPPAQWPTDPQTAKAMQLGEKNDWKAGAEVMRQAVANSPQNPEYHNIYAYMIRKGPNPDMDLVFKHYREALRLLPDYRGAHEYIGEAYLMTGNLPKAKEHLATLDRLCFFGCEEYSMLKKAVAEYEAKNK
jgi:tetratricopeptide (TPR) repeat protein